MVKKVRVEEGMGRGVWLVSARGEEGVGEEQEEGAGTRVTVACADWYVGVESRVGRCRSDFCTGNLARWGTAGFGFTNLYADEEGYSQCSCQQSSGKLPYGCC